MGLAQRFYNAPPFTGALALLDKQGRKYWYRWENEDLRPALALVHYGQVVAHVYLEWEPSDLAIMDMVIDRARFKNRGLGTAMLLEVIAFAKHKRAPLLAGFVSRADCAVNPHLLGWYQKHGFSITPMQDERWAAKIALPLTPAS